LIQEGASVTMDIEHATGENTRAEMTLSETWLKDQAIAFASTLLGTFDPSSDVRALACARS